MKSKFILLFIMYTFFAQSPRQLDSLALISIYNFNGGINWDNAWAINTPINTWFGVTVTNNRVTRLLKSGHGLTGVLPSQIGNLTELTNLDLSNNNILDSLPKSLSNLIKLEEINFSHNEFNSLNLVDISNLKKLKKLNLKINKFTSISTNMFTNLDSLIDLDLSFNRFAGQIPEHLKNLKLKYLKLNDNKFDSLSNFKQTKLDSSLILLDIKNNLLTFNDVLPNIKLTSLPQNFIYFPQITSELDIVYKVLTGDSLILKARNDFKGSNYKWFSNNQEIQNVNSNFLIVRNMSYLNDAVFTYTIKHDSAPELTIFSAKKYVYTLKTPLISVSVHQNPGASNLGLIYVISDIPLDVFSPTTIVKNGLDSVIINYIKIDQFLYKGDIYFSKPGNYNLRTTCFALNGLNSLLLKNINVVLVKPNTLATLIAPSSGAKMVFSNNSIESDKYYFIEENNSISGNIYKFSSSGNSKQSAKLEININSNDFVNYSKLYIAVKQGELWAPLKSHIDISNKKVYAMVTSLGEYKLVDGTNELNENNANLNPNLLQNFPNPFNPVTNIPFSLSKNESVEIIIYNLLGQRIKTLVNNSFFAAGNYVVEWNSTNNDGAKVASGIYFYTLKTATFFNTKKMILIK